MALEICVKVEVGLFEYRLKRILEDKVGDIE